MKTNVCRGGFTLVELVVAIAISSVLSALLLSAFFATRTRSQQSICLSNLHQIGVGTALYMQDNDGFYPRAVDPVDRYSEMWRRVPEFGADVSRLPWVQDVLQPYISSKPLFHCPSDRGFEYSDFSPVLKDVSPSSYERFGTSYYYRTELAAYRISDSRVQKPETINVFFDGSGEWHGTLFPLQQRYNVLYADNHVKNVTRVQINEAWSTPL